METETETIRRIKAYYLHELPYFTKVKLGTKRIDNVKFDESKFVIRYDLNHHHLSHSKYLTLGDMCGFNQKFRQELYHIGNLPDFSNDKFVIIAFIEMSCRNHQGIFCAIARDVDALGTFNDISCSGTTLWLYWPEELEKV
ncbi:MAG: hypothetical protein PHO56_01155 [Patescibacteria group bacterium]|nr:hypothetical protein [Patescibacteria group bacterium]